MSNEPLTWQTVDRIAAAMNANSAALKKWRQRGVPFQWQVKIAAELQREGCFVSLPLVPVIAQARGIAA